MLFLDETHLLDTGIDWNKTTSVIEEAVKCLKENDFAQPVKPYLRYRDKKNRIIAMPAFVGGNINMAGIKWIASFPGNLSKGIPRAHSVVILNNADTGEPMAVICSALLSIIRTASVSALMIRYFERVRGLNNLTIGISGFGPIGRHHLKMCLELLGDKIEKIYVYDIRPIDPAAIDSDERIVIAGSWEEAYLSAGIFITCTVADAPYIDKRPREGSLHINASLRDYTTGVFEWFRNTIVVDDWTEVCRERTDIEMMHLEKGLEKEQTKSIVEVVEDNCLEEYQPGSPVMFNPMGMAVFDIAIGHYYYQAEMSKMLK